MPITIPPFLRLVSVTYESNEEISLIKVGLRITDKMLPKILWVEFKDFHRDSMLGSKSQILEEGQAYYYVEGS